MDYDTTARIFKAFCDPNRLMVLELLQTGEKCACVLQREGKWTHYSISEETSKQAMVLLSTLTSVMPSSICNRCN